MITVQDYKHTTKIMWMDEQMYSVKAKSQAGNIWVKNIMTTKKVKPARYSARDIKGSSILPENSAESLRT